MNKLEYAPLVKKKLMELKKWLIDKYDERVAKEVITGIVSDAEILIENEHCGINISQSYNLDTKYWYLFSHQHYLIYRIETNKVVIVQMFHEREDFMMKLFGVSGRTQESIDYWGE